MIAPVAEGQRSLPLSFRALAHCAALALVKYQDVRCFNASCTLLPVGRAADEEPLSHVMFRIVDRGDPDSPLTDIGAFELFGPVVYSKSQYDMLGAIDAAMRDALGVLPV